MACTITLVGMQAEAEDASVTFYSHAVLLRGDIPKSTHAWYLGSIYDGNQGLVHFLDSHVAHNNRYITLRFTPGTHVFGASYGKHPKPEETLTLTLVGGRSYFVRAHDIEKGVPIVFSVPNGRLDLMSCSDAHIEMTHARQLKEKALWKSVRKQRASLVVDEVDPPPCD